MQWFFGCYGNGDLERVQTFINTFGINKDQVAIFRTDTIPVTLLADNKREKSKANVKHRKSLLALIAKMSAGGDADKIATLDDPEVMNAMQEKYGIR